MPDSQDNASIDPIGRKLMKVAINGDEWDIKWSQGNEVRSLKSTDRPNPELPEEMRGLLKYALEAAAYVDKKYHEKAHVSSITFDWKGDDNRRNAVVMLAVDAGAHGFVKIPTPKKLADSTLDEKKKGRWDTNAVAQFDKIEEQVFAYVDGERSQQEMPIFDNTKSGKKVKAEKGFDFDNELEAQGTA